MSHASRLTIRPAAPADIAHIHAMINELAVFEKLEHLVVATEAMLHEGLFGARPACEAIVGEADGEVVTFALFFHNFSTFLTRRGLAVERECGRFEWSVLDWNKNAIDFYEGMGAELLPDWRICRVAGPALAALATA